MKWASKKCGFFAVFSAFLLLGLFGASSANAITYDWKVADKLYIGDPDTNGACHSNYKDMTLNWSQMLNEQETNGVLGWQYTWNAGYYGQSYEDEITTFKTNFETSLNSPEQRGWAVAQAGYGNTNGKVRIYHFDPTTTFEFFDEVSGSDTIHVLKPDKNVYYVDFFFNHNAGCRYQSSFGVVNANSHMVSYDHIADFLFLNANITYAPGYTGEQMPDTYSPPRKPDFNYTVSSAGLLKVDYLDNAETKPDKAFEVQLTQTGDDWEMPLTPVDDRTISPAYAMGYEYQLPNAGYYHVGIFYEDESELDGVALQFYWNGFSAVNGTTVGGCYDGDGVCNPELQETHPIVRILNSLPVNDFGLQQLVRAPIDFFATLPGRAEECAPITLTMPFANAPVTLPCLTTAVFQPHFPTLLTIWQTVITGIVAYGVSIKIFATVKNVQTPDNDRIEVAKL